MAMVSEMQLVVVLMVLFLMVLSVVLGVAMLAEASRCNGVLQIELVEEADDE